MAINREQTFTTGASGGQVAIPLNRHGNPQYSIDIDIGGGGDVTVEATLSQINRGDTAIWRPIPALTNVTADAFDKIVNTPFEAIRLNITSITDTIIFRVQQNT